MHDALISIKPNYVDRFIDGSKGVEIRSRYVKLLPYSRLWIYSTLPKGCVQAVGCVDRVDRGSPASIWDKYSDAIAVSKESFNYYVNGSNKISAIIVKQIWELPTNLSLKILRAKVPGFHPPQFIKYMGKSDPLLSAIAKILYAKFGAEYCKIIGLNGFFQRRDSRNG